ncbi:hypothetical protein B0J11DRAFT_129135 [Dendryphion nanum]|uniref:SH3 domain-containing protein n=1 Tax=Dendryphion nanum TaxID=256645 RepID=A0A9P9DAA1_9PLEO|nr:hypothetical protein B0J11DRAFT_129135 [Dendryphion nanum]
MAHHHGRLHKLVQRQRFRQDDDDEDEKEQQQREKEKERQERQRQVETVVNVIFKTMPKTFTGEAKFVTQSAPPGVSLIAPAIRTTAPAQATSKPKDESSKPSETKKPSAVSKSSEFISEITSVPTNIQDAGSSIAVATEPPVQTGALASAGIASAVPTAAAAASEGMSGGTKAGLALGILAGVGILLAFILLFYHRKKKQIRAKQQLDDEKTAMRELPPPPPAAIVQTAPSIRSQRTMSTAPRLSLRPVTQFSPTFGENRKSGGNLLSVTAAAAVPRQSPTSDRPGSSWERPGAANAAHASPADPFSDPQARSPSPPQNPFTNNAAIDSPHNSVHSTPHSANDLIRDPEMNGFPMPAPIIAAAAVPVHRSQPSYDDKELPPPGINIESNAVPPSPAWTDDIPESPGPAPTGPPPVAAPNNVHRVQLDFRPSMQDELELRAGQLVRMLHEYDDGWALCLRMDRSQQGVVPRTCVSKHPVKPRTGPPGQRPRGPPINSAMGPGGVPHPRPLTPSSGRNSPHPPALSPANGRMSPAPSSNPRSMSPPQQQQQQHQHQHLQQQQYQPHSHDQPRSRSNSNAPPAPFAAPHPRSLSPGPQNMPPPQNRGRSNSNAPYAGQPRSMSPGPYGGGPQSQLPPPQMGRPRSNSAGQVQARKASPVGPSPMNPNAAVAPVPARKPVPGLAL